MAVKKTRTIAVALTEQEFFDITEIYKQEFVNDKCKSKSEFVKKLIFKALDKRKDKNNEQ